MNEKSQKEIESKETSKVGGRKNFGITHFGVHPDLLP